MIATVRRAVLGVLLILLAAPAAHAQGTGTYTSAPLEWGAGFGTAWVDFDGDGKTDFCRVLASVKIACTVSTGTGFGATYTSDALDWGYNDGGRMWGDVNGDHRADYCRRVGNGGADSRIACSLSTGTGFSEVGNSLQDWGALPGSALVDATGDGAADFCRVTGSDPYYATCSPNGLGTPFSSAALAPGADAGRAFADFTGDGKADFCRVTTLLTCAISSGAGFPSEISTFPGVDRGYEPGRAWADVNADGKADYCRRVGGGADGTRIQCTLSAGDHFGADFTSAPLEWGSDSGYAWVDFDGDGDRDFCRPVAPSATNQQLFCTLWTPAGLANTIVSGPVDLGADGAWVDHNGDGKTDYCRRTGGGSDTRVTCTISNGTAFGPLPTPTPPPGPPAPQPLPPVVTKTRIRVTVAYEYSSISRRYTRLTRLVVKSVPKGSTVKATCKKGCARKSYTKRNARGTVSLSRMIRKRLRAGTVIKVVVSRPDRLSATKTLRARSGKRPTVR